MAVRYPRGCTAYNAESVVAAMQIVPAKRSVP